MPVTFTNILATATDAAQIVAQEPTGFISAVDFRPDIQGASLNQPVNIGRVGTVAGSNWSAGIKTSLPSAITETGDTMSLNQAREFQFDITGEQLKGLDIGNYNAQVYLRDKTAEAMRSLRNEIDSFTGVLAKNGASRAVGTAGTTPFGSTMDATADLRRILVENGAPSTGLSLVVNAAAGANVRKILGSMVAAAGSQAADLQKTGGLPNHNGFSIYESTQILTHTKGTGASYVTSGSSAAGAQNVALVTGSGTVLAGDVVTFAADSANAYVVNTGVAAPGTIVLNRPGLRNTIATANALTVGNSYTPNIGLHRNAIILVVRPPAQADIQMNGGQPFQQSVVTDPVTGMPYGLYAQAFDGGILISVRAIWGGVVANPYLVATLMG